MDQVIGYLNDLKGRGVFSTKAGMFPNRGTWIFRGQSEGGHALIPSVGRLGIELEQEVKAYRKFQKALPSYFYNLSTRWDLMVLAQHHGVPTRLLDWTFNPLTALFFACENESVDRKNGVVYALRTSQNKEPDKPLSNVDPFLGNKAKASKYSALYRHTPNDIIPRILVQEGVFVWFKNPAECLLKNKPKNWECISIEIDSSVKKQLKKELFNLGFTYARIYSDLDNVGATLAWEMKNMVVSGKE